MLITQTTMQDRPVWWHTVPSFQVQKVTSHPVPAKNLHVSAWMRGTDVQNASSTLNPMSGGPTHSLLDEIL